jgi:acetoin utilization protein AcuB
MDVRSIMTSDVLTLSPRQPASDALASMRDAGVRHAVVRSMGSVVGLVSDRDLGGAHAGAFRRLHVVEDLMRRTVTHVDPNTTIQAAAVIMREEHIGCLPVLLAGELVGIVTRGDVLTALATGRKSRGPRAGANEDGTPPRAPRFVSPNRDKWP